MAPVRPRRLEEADYEPFIADLLTALAILQENDIEGENIGRVYLLVDWMFLSVAEAALRFHDGDVKAAFKPVSPSLQENLLRRLPAELFAR